MARRRTREPGRAGPVLQIAAGELGGRRLQSPPGDVRPTAQRTREAMFSMLGPDAVAGADVLDLFCGSGSLAIEALSRGAAHATLADIEIETAAANVEALGLRDRAELIERSLPGAMRPKGALGGRTYDLVFCDPPYTLAASLGPDLDSLAPQLLAPGGILIVESPASDPIRLTLPALRERAYGAAHVGLYTAPEGNA